MDASQYYSDIARSGPPLFFPDPTTDVTFNFDQGIPARETFPMEALKQLHAEIFERDDRNALEYITFDWDADQEKVLYLPTYVELVLGNTELRALIADWLNQRTGTQLSDNSIILTSGSVQAIALAMNGLIDEGDGVFVESSTFPYALRYIEMRAGKLYPVALDDQGMNMDALEEQLQRAVSEGVKPKLVYTIPTFQMPTCTVMPLERRQRLLELADEYDFLVLEDNIYGDLRYSGEPVPTLLSLDQAGRVLQSHGFTKIVAPALRLGWMAGNPDLIAALAAVRQDLGVSQLTSRVMIEFLKRGMLDPHLEQANDLYRQKRDAAAAAVEKYCGDDVSFSLPEGGFYLWLRLPEDVDWEKAQAEAAARGVQCRPDERFMGANLEMTGDRHLRIAYSHVGLNEIERGIKALGEAIQIASK